MASAATKVAAATAGGSRDQYGRLPVRRGGRTDVAGRALPGVMQKHRALTLERLDKFVSNLYWTDCNLSSCCQGVAASQPLESLSVFSVPDLQRIPFAAAAAARADSKFHSTAVGQSFGPSWSTHWFCFRVSCSPRYYCERATIPKGLVS